MAHEQVTCAEEPKAQDRCTWAVCLCFIPAGVNVAEATLPGTWQTRKVSTQISRQLLWERKNNVSCLTFQVRFRISRQSKRMQCHMRCLTIHSVILNWGPGVQECACRAHCFMLLTITTTSEKNSPAPQSFSKDSSWRGFPINSQNTAMTGYRFFQRPHAASRNYFPPGNKDTEGDRQASAPQRMLPTENLQHLRVRNQECPFNSSLRAHPESLQKGQGVLARGPNLKI